MATQEKQPAAPVHSDSEEMSSTDVADDPGYQSRSRSQSRRRRRQNQRQRQSLQQQRGGAQANSNALTAVQEEDGPQQAEASSDAQMLQRVGGPESSMAGPVTHARAQRGEVAMRDGDQNQQLSQGPREKEEKGIMDEEGLKLRLELNLDIEIELKASIHGDLTLALLA